MELIIDSITLLVRVPTSIFNLKEKIFSPKFQQIPNVFSFGKCSGKSWSFTPIFLWCSVADNHNALLLGMNLVRWKPPDLHMLVASIWKSIEVFYRLQDHQNKCDEKHLLLLLQKLLHFPRLSCARQFKQLADDVASKTCAHITQSWVCLSIAIYHDSHTTGISKITADPLEPALDDTWPVHLTWRQFFLHKILSRCQ